MYVGTTYLWMSVEVSRGHFVVVWRPLPRTVRMAGSVLEPGVAGGWGSQRETVVVNGELNPTDPGSRATGRGIFGTSSGSPGCSP